MRKSKKRRPAERTAINRRRRKEVERGGVGRRNITKQENVINEFVSGESSKSDTLNGYWKFIKLLKQVPSFGSWQ